MAVGPKQKWSPLFTIILIKVLVLRLDAAQLSNWCNFQRENLLAIIGILILGGGVYQSENICM